MLTAVSLRNPTGPLQAVAGTQQLSHPQHRPDPGPCSGAKARSGTEGIESVSMGCLHKVLVDRDAVGREKKTAKTVTQIHRRELADRGNTQSQLQAESHALSPQQGSSTAGSRLGGHTHITVTNPTASVSTARDTSAWPAHKFS